MRTNFGTTFLLLVTLLFSSLAPSVASTVHNAPLWLDQAVNEKQCPSTPVNVPAADRLSTKALLSRVFISGNKLFIKGTDDPDHIVVSSGGSSNFVRVAWNGKQLGRFGPVKKVELRGHAGNDVLIVKSNVGLPVLIDGGSDHDCLQGGSGADQLFAGIGRGDDVLIAGRGRPALVGSSGHDRVVIPRHMGTLRYTPSADSGVLRALEEIYDLQPVSASRSKSGDAPGPIILGAGDLGDEQVKAELLKVRAAHEAVVLTNATEADSERLRLLLGHPNAAHGLRGSKTGLAAGGTAPLIYFRTAPRPGTKAFDYSTGFFINLPTPLSDRTIQWLTQIFSATAVVPTAPAGSPANDLQVIADSNTTRVSNENAEKTQVQIVNSVWDVRSFPNSNNPNQPATDYYYVLQEVDYTTTGSQEGVVWFNSMDSQIYSMQPGVLQPSPASTQCTTSTTSGLAWNIGGSAGWNYKQVANATLTGGVSVSNSKTITCPQITIDNRVNPAQGLTQWYYQTTKPNYTDTVTFYNQWLWQVPTTNYQAGQTDISIGSEGQTQFGFPCNSDCNVISGLTSSVALPLGDTFTLGKPQISSVSPTCVNAGDTFAITGSNMYPSMLTSLLIDGTPLSSAQYTSVTDKLIDVVAPSISGDYLPVVVQTGEGVSNSNVTVEISTFGLCGSKAKKK